MQEQLEAAQTELASLEKAHQQEMADAQMEAERATNAMVMTALEEKQTDLDKLAEEWKGKCDTLVCWFLFD